jgi:signal transduction histidine kinase
MKLKKLTQQTHIEQSETQPLTDFIDMALQQWLLMRPLVSFVVKGNLKSFKSSNLLTNVPTVQYPLVLQQAIINLLDNAADSNNRLNYNKNQMPINIELTYNNQSWTMSIQDNGNGIDKSFNLPNSPMISPKWLRYWFAA